MDGRSIEPFPRQRLGTVDYMRVAAGRSDVHGLVELDVTKPRALIDDHETETGEQLSFTAFLVHCLGAAIDEHPDVQAYRDWRGRLHRFDDVDVNVLIETTVDGSRLGVPHVIKAANDRSLRSIHDEIRAAQRNPTEGRPSRWARIAMRLPGVVRRQVWRLPQWFPGRWTDLAGTVAVTSVGMFGSGGGFAISPTNYSLQLTVGGIATKPAFVDGEIEPREFLSLTVTVDHDVIDGAAAARFVERLGELVEAGYGLDSATDESG